MIFLLGVCFGCFKFRHWLLINSYLFRIIYISLYWYPQGLCPLFQYFFNTWCPLKDHIYLKTFNCRLFKHVWIFCGQETFEGRKFEKMLCLVLSNIISITFFLQNVYFENITSKVS